MIGEKINVDEILNAVQTGRNGSKRFNQATDDLRRLARIADKKNEPERAAKKAAAKEQGHTDLTPTWIEVLGGFIDGIRSKRNPQSLRDGMTKNLRGMIEYALAEE